MPRLVRDVRSKSYFIMHCDKTASGCMFNSGNPDNVNVFTSEDALMDLIATVIPSNLVLIFNEMSIGIKHDGTHFFIFESHARNSSGMYDSNGYCILWYVK